MPSHGFVPFFFPQRAAAPWRAISLFLFLVRVARPLRGRRLPAAGAALEARVFQAPALLATAMRTAKAVRPAQLDQVVAAGRLGREAAGELRPGAQFILHSGNLILADRRIPALHRPA